MKKQVTFSIILSFALFLGEVRGDQIGCFIKGECLQSNSVGVTTQNSANSCLDDCKDSASCQQFTFYGDASTCVLYSDCVELSDAGCSDCVSGDVTCDSLEPGMVKEITTSTR